MPDQPASPDLDQRVEELRRRENYETAGGAGYIALALDLAADRERLKGELEQMTDNWKVVMKSADYRQSKIATLRGALEAADKDLAWYRANLDPSNHPDDSTYEAARSRRGLPEEVPGD